jgi:hypothetical protein
MDGVKPELAYLGGVVFVAFLGILALDLDRFIKRLDVKRFYKVYIGCYRRLRI